MESAVIWINAFSTSVTALATAVLAFLTYRLALESRLLRKANSEPRVVAYLAPNPDGNGAVNFVLANYGLGPAFDVHFEIHNDEDDFQNHSVYVKPNPDRTPFAVIPQSEKISVFFGVGYQLFSGEEHRLRPLKPFDVTVRYKDIEKRVCEMRYTLDVAQFTGLAGLANKPALVSISDSMSKIEGHLQKLGGTNGLLSQLTEVTRLSDVYRQKIKK